MTKRPDDLGGQFEELRQAWLDLVYLLLKPFVALVDRIPGLRVKPWVRERQIRERWKDDA